MKTKIDALEPTGRQNPVKERIKVSIDAFRKNGFVMAINHEPLSFLRRAGYAGLNAEKQFLDDHKEENIVKLVDNGCDLIRQHFYKGSGFECEKEEIEMSRQYVDLAHKHGLKVQLYVQFGTIAGETMIAEQPDMMDWIQVDSNGKPITLLYAHQTFRYYPCFNREGYWNYLEKIIYKGIIEAGGDAIGFDNISTSQEPFVCHCDDCKQAFVKFLKDKYRTDTPEGAKRTKERFGHTILDHMLPPVWNNWIHPGNLVGIDNPLIQEWVLFRCESITKIIARLYNFCKQLNPDVLLEFNAYKQFGTNTAFVHGLYLPDFKDYIDAFWNECDEFPRYTDEGVIFTKIRSFKMARAMGKFVFADHPSGSHPGKMIAYAESMAFNHGIINGVEGAAEIYNGKEQDFLGYKKFRNKYPHIYHAESIANVSLYESKASLSFNNYFTYYADIIMQQGLLQGHITYDLLFDLNQIDNYKVVVLPNTECLSDEEIEKLLTFVQNGGGLVFTDDSGEYDIWRRRWENRSLLNRLGVVKESWSTLTKLAFGRGKVVYIPKLRTDKPFDPAFDSNQPWISPDDWGIPFNQDEIMESVKWASGYTIPIEVEAPRHVVAELQKQALDNKLCLHLLNYKSGTDVHNIKVKLTKGLGSGKEIRLLSADSGAEQALLVASDGWITIPNLRNYSVVCFE